MDPITTSIVAALAAGVLKAAEQGVIDAYNGLKNLIARKFGAGTDVRDAVKNLEEHPDSAGRRAVLAETLSESGAVEDNELLEAASALLKQIGEIPGGVATIQQVTGSKNVAQAAAGGTATVTVGTAPPANKP